MRLLSPLLLSVVLVSLPVAGDARPPPLRIGLLASGPTTDADADWEPLTAAVQASLGDGERILLVTLPPDALRAAVLRNELDVVITNPVHFIEIRAEHPLSGAVATMDMDSSDPSTAYFGGVIVRRRDQPQWSTLANLDGARVAYQDRGLLGGYAAPMKRILDAGVRRRSLRMVRIGSPYDGVLDAVLEGRADIGFVRTGVLERWRRRGEPRLDELEVVAPMAVPGFPYVTSTPVFPEWPVVVLPHVDEARGRRFAQAILALEPGSAALAAARIERVTIPADYAGVEALMRDVRLPPFDAPTPITWQDVWQSHRTTVLAGMATVLASLGLAAVLMRSRRRHQQQSIALAAAKQAADEERRRLHGILGAVRAGTWEWNVQTGELRVNRHWAEMIGYRLEELEPIGLETWRAHVHPEDLDKAWAAVQAHLRGETRYYDVDLRMRHKAGHWLLVHDRGEVVARDGEGKALWMCGLHIDISDPGIRPRPDAGVG